MKYNYKTMKKTSHLRLLIISTITVSALLTGCLKQQVKVPDQDDSGKIENKFDYSTTNDIKLNIDYSLKGNKAVFEIYDQNPMTVSDGSIVKNENAKALLKGYTGTDGTYSGVINLPIAVENVYIYTQTYGFPTCVKAEVKENGISLNMKEYLAEINKSQIGKSGTKGADNAPSWDNPYNIQYLGVWDTDGEPDYIISEIYGGERYPIRVSPLPEGLSYRVKNVLIPGTNNSALAKPTEQVNTKIIADATVKLVFFGELSAYRNAIGYYYYDTQNAPKTLEEFDALPKYIAFPNCSMFNEDPYGESGIVGNYMPPLYPGEQMYLTYFDGNGVANKTFPKGTTIGWFIIPDGFEVSPEGNGKLNIQGWKHGVRFSNNEFNDDGARYFVSVYDEPSKKTIIGFEDSYDYDFKDVMIYLETSPEGAISNPDSPSTDPDTDYPNVTGDPIEGTLIFEDLWPSQGDYDMNDVVVGYSTTFTTNKDNNIVSIKDVFTPLHDGGQLACAFGYQLNIDPSNIKSIKIENGSSSAIVNKGMETGQNKPTIMLFDNIRDILNNGPITVTVELTENVSMKDISRKNLYNPFICVNNKQFLPGQPRKEVHLTNYPPTALANISYFGRNDDKTPVDKNGYPTGPRYYVTTDLHPFALDLPITDYRIPNEMVDIGNFYPYFTKWVKSDGKEYKEWYLKPLEK